MFPRTSRYYNIEIIKLTTPDQRDIVYLRRRFLPLAPPSAIIAEHTAIRKRQRPRRRAGFTYRRVRPLSSVCNGPRIRPGERDSSGRRRAGRGLEIRRLHRRVRFHAERAR